MASIFGMLFRGRSQATASAQKSRDALLLEAAKAAAANDYQRAIRHYDAALILDPANAGAHYKRANALKNLGRLDLALAGYDAAIEHDPGHAYAYCNRGVVEQSLGATAAALHSYDRAITLDPADAVACYNRALLMQELFRWDEALQDYDRAIAIDPGYADAQYNRALALLFLGRFEAGWQGFEWRWNNAQRLSIGEARHLTQPRWRGDENVSGRRVLLYSEGGLGDTLQFCRYATSVATLGASVIIEAPAKLLGLLNEVSGVSEVVASGSELPPFDYQCPLMSLPMAFKTSVDTVPASPRYLHSDPTLVAGWRLKLGKEGSGARVGLAWSGNSHNPLDPRRSTKLSDWLPHLPRKFQYFCLQKDIRPADEALLAANPWIFRSDSMSDGFSETAALCDCLDLVISIDTSIAHLSGALGRPTWIVLPYVPDWRWMRDRGDSPWYPTARLYRQERVGDWSGVFARIAADLHCLFG